MLMALLSVGIIFGLPSAHRSQARFNGSVIQARRIAAGAIKRGE